MKFTANQKENLDAVNNLLNLKYSSATKTSASWRTQSDKKNE